MFKSLAGGKMFADVASSPPGIVALHGWGRTSADFRKVITALGGWSIDLPGFGVSPAPSEPWGTAEYAQLLGSVLEELPDPVLIVGHSFGGRVALRLAASRPDLVKGMVLTGVPLVRRLGPPQSSTRRYRVIKRLHKLRLLGDRRLERARQEFGSEDYRAAQGIMREVLVQVVNESYESDLEAVLQPVEMVWGERDTAVSPEVAREACKLIRRCNLVIEANCSHLLPTEKPAALVAAVERVGRTLTESTCN